MDWDSMVSREVANVLRRGGRTLRNLFRRISPEEGVRTRPTRMTKTKILNDGEVTSTDGVYTQYITPPLVRSQGGVGSREGGQKII